MPVFIDVNCPFQGLVTRLGDLLLLLQLNTMVKARGSLVSEKGVNAQLDRSESTDNALS